MCQLRGGSKALRLIIGSYSCLCPLKRRSALRKGDNFWKFLHLIFEEREIAQIKVFNRLTRIVGESLVLQRVFLIFSTAHSLLRPCRR